MGKPSALGKGLGALISSRSPGALTAPHPGERIVLLPHDQIVVSPLQPRQDFNTPQFTELVESIRERGIIQPLIVRKVEQHYELIAGERRWRAAQEVGLADLPAIVRTATDREVLEIALVENLQREDLNPIEEAQAYNRLSYEFSMTQEEIAQKVGKNRATVANAMRLLDLDSEVLSYVRQNRLSVGHGKALLPIKVPEEQRALADILIRQGASVRETEKLVAKWITENGQPSPSKKRTSAEAQPALAPAIQRIENHLQHHLATRVVLKHKEKAGTISIEYYGSEDLSRILTVLGIALPE